MTRFKQTLQISIGWVFIALLGCHPAQQGGAPPPAAVSVSKPVQREVVDWDNYTGHLDSPNSVVVAARVSGLIESMPFVEGSIVKTGQVLCTIDVRPFQADLDAQVGNEAKAAAQVEIAQSNFDREAQALKGNAVSQQDYDNAKATLEQNKAQLVAAKAAVEAARLNVEFCKVVSPIDGRVGNKMVTVGNLITGGGTPASPTQLTSIQSIDPMYCYVDVDENSVLKYQKLAADKKHARAMDAKVPCFLELANETEFPREGYIDFIDNHVDPSTGTMRVRGVFANPTGEMRPGYFATMRVPGSGQYQTLLVPDRAIGTDQNNRYVLVLGANNVVMARNVTLGTLFGSLRSITDGLSPDDVVVIDGLMHARPGLPVAPTEEAIQVNPADFAAGKAATSQAISATQTANSSKNSNSAATTEPAQ